MKQALIASLMNFIIERESKVTGAPSSPSRSELPQKDRCVGRRLGGSDLVLVSTPLVRWLPRPVFGCTKGARDLECGTDPGVLRIAFGQAGRNGALPGMMVPLLSLWLDQAGLRPEALMCWFGIGSLCRPSVLQPVPCFSFPFSFLSSKYGMPGKTWCCR
jgi:hypothetical protein